MSDKIQTPRMSTMALVSLISGIAGWTVLPVLGTILAIVVGHLARREIRNGLGDWEGDTLAFIGLVLGYSHLAIVVLPVLMMAFLFFVFGIGVFGAFLALL